MSTHLDQILMTVVLIDKTSGPLKDIREKINETAKSCRESWAKMGEGVTGLISAGSDVKAALMPAIEMDRALGEVKSLGVVDEELQKLQQSALGFSCEYGKSATEFVNASYAIKKGFSGITGDELADVTKSSAVLAAATKADTGTVTSYMTNMFQVFKSQAQNMGISEWSQQLAGMTAQSVAMFGSTTQGMGDAFSVAGEKATAAGVKMHEQMAILGTLQSTMSGSQAGEQYDAFLSGIEVTKAGLGITFKDSQGQILPMLDILEQLKGKFGDTLEAAELAELSTAFGGDKAANMFKALMQDTDSFASNLEKLGSVTGMDKATSMAKAQTDQWQRLEQSWVAVRTSAFSLILPAINGIVGAMADSMTGVLEWTQLFPELTSYVAYAAVAIIGSAAAPAAWSLVVGAASFITSAWATALGVLQGVMEVVRIGVILTSWAFKALSACMLANPVFLIVAGIVALGAVVIGVIAYWDELIAALNKIWIFRQIGAMFADIGASVCDKFDQLVQGWGRWIDAIINCGLVQGVVNLVGQVFNIVSGLFTGVVTFIAGIFQAIGVYISVLLVPIRLVFHAFKALFALLVDGPEAGMAVLSAIPALFFDLFADICARATAAWELIRNGFLTFCSYLNSAILFLAQPFIWLVQQVVSAFQSMFTLLTEGWNNFTSWLSDLSVFELLGDGIDWLIDKINLIPGIEIDTQAKVPDVPAVDLPTAEAKLRSKRINRPISRYLQGTQTAQVPTQGYMPKVAKAMQGNGSKTMHTGDIHIKQEQPFTQAQLYEWDEMNTQ